MFVHSLKANSGGGNLPQIARFNSTAKEIGSGYEAKMKNQSRLCVHTKVKPMFDYYPRIDCSPCFVLFSDDCRGITSIIFVTLVTTSFGL